jgi:hypothetical protein
MVKAGDGGRIVSVSSRAPRRLAHQLDDIGGEQRFSGYRIYGQSESWRTCSSPTNPAPPDGAASPNCLHPGVATGFGHNNSDLFGRTFGFVLGAIRPFSSGARRETSIFLASSPEPPACQEGTSPQEGGQVSPETYDETAAQGAWRPANLTQLSAAT